MEAKSTFFKIKKKLKSSSSNSNKTISQLEPLEASASTSGSGADINNKLNLHNLQRLTIQSEILSFKQRENLDRKGDPLGWWKENQTIYPCLSTLAQRYLSCPPYSIESKRLFSIGGNR